jgi:hypothetical protein
MSLSEKLLACLPANFLQLKDQMEALGKNRTFTIVEFAECTRTLELKDAIENISLPTLEQSTVDAFKKAAKNLTGEKLMELKLKNYAFRNIRALSKTKFCLFAVSIELKNQSGSGCDKTELEEKSLQSYTGIQFYEYIFYASASDVDSLQKI